MKTRSIVIAAAAICLLSSRANGGEQYARLAPIGSFAAYVYADENSTSLGIDAQMAADYVAGLLGKGGITTSQDSGTFIQVCIYSTALRNIQDRAQVMNTHAFTITVECIRPTENGHEMLWRDLHYGGYTGMSAEFIVNEIQSMIDKSVNAFCGDYARDRRSGTSAEPAGMRRAGA